MQDGENLYLLGAKAVGNDEGGAGDDEFTGSFHPTGAAEMGMLSQHLSGSEDAVDHLVRHRLALGGQVLMR